MLPESPRFHFLGGDRDGAYDTLKWLYYGALQDDIIHTHTEMANASQEDDQILGLADCENGMSSWYEILSNRAIWSKKGILSLL